MVFRVADSKGRCCRRYRSRTPGEAGREDEDVAAEGIGAAPPARLEERMEAMQAYQAVEKLLRDLDPGLRPY
jgi:hypothetical protein